MATLSDPPQESFKLSMLINDTRYRALTFQAIAAILLALAFVYLGNNLIQNLRTAGFDISFAFLHSTAGYEVDQTLIDYDPSSSTHGRVLIVGALNTLLVAFLACVTATVFGVFAGVLRLSNNWLVSKLMSAYVEIFRNIPVLVWIIIIYTLVSQTLPRVRTYLGNEPERELLFGMFAFTNRGIYIPAPVWSPGSMVVISAFILSVAGVFVYRGYAKRLLYATGQLLPTGWPSLAILLVPTILMYFIMGQPIGLDAPDPLANRFNLQGGVQVGSTLIALWFALSIYTGAFIAENVRAGIQAISKGQTEAAAALGLRPGRITNLVVLPQAQRVIIPPLISQYLNITKNSSLAIVVGYEDIVALGGITINQTGQAIPVVLLWMLFYLTISLLISAFMNVYNASIKLKER